ncbi:MAG: glycosyltransferase family 4 protein [Chloroflexi bacterium]|nr:glycosyltransferase family 4 protein [Chloroflexota bacterium]MYC54522.1 glycosyltransferase family 4 protein [Chloroflexota bacterium]
MRLLLFNLATDETDPVLAFACDWISHLADHCDTIDVLTMRRGSYQLPDNARVFSVGRERGWSKARRTGNFYLQLLRLLRHQRYDACFAHMMPLFAGLGGPILRARGIPITLWYTHRQRSWQLRLGQAFAQRIVSADASSYPYPSERLRVLGHGIDTDYHSPLLQPPSDEDSPLVVQVARLSAIKNQATTIQAVNDLPARLALIGGVQPGFPEAYRAELQSLIADLGLSARCQLVGDQSRGETLAWYQRAWIAVNMSPPGLFDKAALESMACGVPTIVANPAFAPLLGEHPDLLLTDSPSDAPGLRKRIAHICGLSRHERAAIGRQLRANVVREHSLPRLIDRLMSVLQTGELPA